MKSIDGDQAWTSLARAERSQWEADRFEADVFPIVHSPRFPIARDARFFCMGSCFARNIEEHLIYLGLNVLSKRIVAPAEEWPARTTGLVNKFTSESILNEVRWALTPPDAGDPLLYSQVAEGWLDLQLAPGVRPVSLDRAVERRTYLTHNYFARLRSADIVVLTLGLNEVWKDHARDVYLNVAPTLWEVRRNKGRYSLEITDVAANLAALVAIREVIKTLNPSARMIVTVSPVPLSGTFSGVDIVRANTLSKAVLRAAAEAFVQDHDDVDYFPSYEIVTHSPRHRAYAHDRLHVMDDVVGAIMGLFTRLYIGEIEPVAPGFRDLAYLAANPDIEAVVRLGHFESGLEHWLKHGRDEGRLMVPAVATDLMKAAGVGGA